MNSESRVKPSRRRRRGFTLIEAMAAVVLLGIGIVGAMSAFNTVIRTETISRQKEKMQSLAEAKLAELQALGTATTAADGDFTDQNEPDYTWSLQADVSGITDLDAVTLTVTHTGTDETAKVATLVYIVPEGTTTNPPGGATP